jgi:hypothetical protein
MGEIQGLKELGAIIRKSGFVPSSIKTDEQAVVILLKGQELGLPPMQAFASIAVINGRPTLTAEVMLSLVYKQHEKAGITFVSSTNQECVIEASRPGGKTSTFTFTLEDAKRAGLLAKGPWEQYPAAMLRARCISAMARAMFPDALAGCVYTPEELGAQVDQEGAVLEVKSEIVEAQQPKKVIISGTKKVEPPKQKQPVFELKWEGIRPSCMTAKVPFGKLKGTDLVDLSMPEALAMADWIKEQTVKGKVPPSWVEFYFAVMDYEEASQPKQETEGFEGEFQTSIAGLIHDGKADLHQVR